MTDILREKIWASELDDLESVQQGFNAPSDKHGDILNEVIKQGYCGAAADDRR